MSKYTASEIAQQIANGSTSAEATTNHFIEKIKEHNPKLNSIVIDNTAVALESAKAYDQNPTGGRLGGVPVVVKESFNMKGLKTTCNFKGFEHYIAMEDSIVVQRLYQEGAVILGKTNIPVLLGDHQSYGPFYPTANNPWNLNKTPGGSTGGGAAAVAAGLTTFETGSDIGGSIRVPAHFNGIFGLKPSENMYPELGHLPTMPNGTAGWSAMASYGPLARTMTDIELAYNVVCAPDYRHRANLPMTARTPLHDSISNYKVAWINELGGFHASDDTKSVVDNFINTLNKSGVDTSKIIFPQSWFDKIVEIWGVFYGLLTGAEMSNAQRAGMKQMYTKMDAGADLRIAHHIQRGFGCEFKDFTNATRLRQHAEAELFEYFQDYDFIISPIMMGPAFDHNHDHAPITIDGKQVHYIDHNLPFPMPWNSLGNPALAIPAGQSKEGMPIGLQVVGPVHSERALIHFGKMLEELGFDTAPPPGFEA